MNIALRQVCDVGNAYIRVAQSPASAPDEVVMLRQILDSAVDIYETIAVRSSGLSFAHSLEIAKSFPTLKLTPFMTRFQKLFRWIRRKSFLCVLHAAGLLDMTGKVRREREQLGAAAGKRRKRSRADVETESIAFAPVTSTNRSAIDPADTIANASAHSLGPSPLVEKVFMILHRKIAMYL